MHLSQTERSRSVHGGSNKSILPQKNRVPHLREAKVGLQDARFANNHHPTRRTSKPRPKVAVSDAPFAAERVRKRRNQQTSMP